MLPGRARQLRAGVLGDEHPHQFGAATVGRVLGRVGVGLDPLLREFIDSAGDVTAQSRVELSRRHARKRGYDRLRPVEQVILHRQLRTAEAAASEMNHPVTLRSGGHFRRLVKPMRDHLFTQRPECDALTSAADRRKQLVLTGGHEHDVRARRRFFECFQERVLTRRVEQFRLVDDEHLVVPQGRRLADDRRVVTVVTRRPADHLLAQKIDGDVRLLAVAQHFDARFASQLLANQVQVRVRRPRRIRRVGDSVPQPARFTRVARADPPRQVTLRFVTQQYFRERQCGRALTHTGGPVKNVRVMRPVVRQR